MLSMSLFGGDRTELNPKYVTKLIEARLYAIKEKNHLDGAIFTFYCPHCKHNNTVMKPLFFNSITMESFMRIVSGYRFETHTCVCGAKLNYNNIIIAQYSHFFPDTGLDMEAEIRAGNDFVEFYKMDLDGNREPVKNCMDFRCIYENFGHVLSPRECWRYMLGVLHETGNIQLFNIEKGYTIVALTSQSPHAKVNIRELVGPDWPGESAVVVKLRDLEGESLYISETYCDWMPEFKDEILRGHIDAMAVVDTAAMQAILKRTLNNEGMDYNIHENDCIVIKKPFKASISIKDAIKEAVYCGKSIQEVVDDKVNIAMNRIFTAENIYKNIRRDLPSYEFNIQDEFLEVINPRNGLSDKINLYAQLPKGGIRSLVSSIRDTLNKEEQFQPVCKCGKEAFIIKSIEPVSWLSRPENVEAFNYVYEERENAIIVYYISCGEHTAPVMKTDLAEWVVERKTLDDIFEQELDNLRINIEAHAGVYGRDRIVGLLSNKACDIMVHPAFIKGLLDAVDIDLGSRVIVYAPLKEMVLIYREDTELDNLNKAVMDLQNIAMTKEIGQTALDYIEVFDIDKGHGIFNIIELPEKQSQEQPDQGTEDQKQVADDNAKVLADVHTGDNSDTNI